MDKDTKEMLKKVIIYDILISVIILVVSLALFRNYVYVLIIGLIMALINFILNAVITGYIIRLGGNASFYILGAMIRIVTTAAVVVLLAENNIYNVIAFLIGYSSHYVAVFYFGATRRITRKGK